MTSWHWAAMASKFDWHNLVGFSIDLTDGFLNYDGFLNCLQKKNNGIYYLKCKQEIFIKKKLIISF
jgi:hypothetical protein